METCSLALSLSLALEFCLSFCFSLCLYFALSLSLYIILSLSLSFLLFFSIYIAMTDEKYCLLRSSFIAYRFGFEIDEDSLPLTAALTPYVTPTVTPAATTASAPVPTASVPLVAVLSKGSSNATSSIRVLANDSNNNYNGERGKTEGEREREKEWGRAGCSVGRSTVQLQQFPHLN